MDEPITSVMLDALQAYLEHARPALLSDLEHLVSIDSGTYDKPGVDEVTSWMAEQLEGLGATVERNAGGEFGDTVVATIDGVAPGPTILLLGHADTVFERGTASARPLMIEGDRITGPGAADMKGGLLAGLYALRALRSSAPDVDRWLPAGRLVYIVDSDEEIGSPSSTRAIRAAASSADVALVLEGARPDGAIVSARKGMMHFRVELHGRAAHSGVDPDKGRSATLEAAFKTIALHELNGRWDGVTVNVGVIEGGTRPNIVAGSARMEVDMRATTLAEQEAATAAMQAILSTPTVADVSADVEITAHHRPMERSEASARIVDRAIDIAGWLGFELHDAATGGGSDANTTAGMGVPTLDGLGPIAGDAHADSEYIEAGSIVPRATLLAGLISSLLQAPLQESPQRR